VKKSVLLSLWAMLMNCSTPDSHEASPAAALHVLVETAEFRLPIPARMRPYFSSFQVFEDKDTTFLTVFNDVSAAVDFFNCETRRWDISVPLVREGPNSIGPGMLLRHYIFNRDTIAIVNAVTNVLLLFDAQGRLLEKYVNNTGNNFISFSVGSPFRRERYLYWPAFKQGLPNFSADNTQFRCLVRIDIQHNEQDLLIPMPKAYNKGIWGQMVEKYMVYGAYNPHLDHYCHGFAIHPDISLLALDSERVILSKQPRSRYLGGEIKPFPYQGDKKKVSFRNNLELHEKVKDYDRTTSFFGHLLYDPYRKVYLRFHIIKASDLTQTTDSEKFSILILDEKLDVLGEALFSERDHTPYQSFITREGLHIKKQKTDSDDEMVFTVFALREMQ
jgi:hypothetical protein